MASKTPFLPVFRELEDIGAALRPHVLEYFRELPLSIADVRSVLITPSFSTGHLHPTGADGEDACLVSGGGSTANGSAVEAAKCAGGKRGEVWSFAAPFGMYSGSICSEGTVQKEIKTLFLGEGGGGVVLRFPPGR